MISGIKIWKNGNEYEVHQSFDKGWKMGGATYYKNGKEVLHCTLSQPYEDNTLFENLNTLDDFMDMLRKERRHQDDSSDDNLER